MRDMLTSATKEFSMFTGFAQYLIEQKLLEGVTLKKILTLNNNHSETLVAKLITSYQLDHTILAKTIANYFKLPFIDLDKLQYDEILPKSLQAEVIQKYLVLPLTKTNEQLQLALADPTDTSVLNAIKFHTTLNIKPVVVAYDQLLKTIKKVLPQKKYDSSIDEDTSIIKFIDQILSDAISKQASDIHFEPYNEFCRIRFRIDGLLYEFTKTDPGLAQRFSARLKIMANLDIAEKRLPQDGHFTLKLANHQNHDCRLSICPTLFGEKLVVRILNPIN